MPFAGVSERVEMQVAIAFGASVQPFTKITAVISSIAITDSGPP